MIIHSFALYYFGEQKTLKRGRDMLKKYLKMITFVDHPALMPLYLPVIPILTTSKEGDIVLYPFSGSGTTGKTALIFGRKYIG